LIIHTDLKEIKPKPQSCSASSEHVQSGIPIPKAMRVRNFSPKDWEEFVEEWASSIDGIYRKVRRLGGACDLGVDIAGFYSEQGFQGAWDNYQCKRYKNPLSPSDIWIEIGKILYYSCSGEYVPPLKHYFICSQGIGTSLEKLLSNPEELKRKTKENWIKYCQTSITETTPVYLSGELEEFFDEFDFSIFSSKSHLELIESHSKTAYHVVRFGGGLPPRPIPSVPPEQPVPSESKYILKLIDAYGDHLGIRLKEVSALEQYNNLKQDYLRQRERFYHAEALRNFARDTVPEGTFDVLQDEVYHGVVDVCEGNYASGFERMKATVAQASQVSVTSNPLATAIRVQDRQGICHQLANDDRLTWVHDHE
jgi:hypothetical protein